MFKFQITYFAECTNMFLRNLNLVSCIYGNVGIKNLMHRHDQVWYIYTKHKTGTWPIRLVRVTLIMIIIIYNNSIIPLNAHCRSIMNKNSTTYCWLSIIFCLKWYKVGILQQQLRTFKGWRKQTVRTPLSFNFVK